MFSRQKKSKVPVKEGRWSAEEHQRFLQGMMIYGRRWTKVADIVGTRNTVQVRSHAQKYEMKIEKHADRQCANGGGSDGHDLDGTSWSGVAEVPQGPQSGNGQAMMSSEDRAMMSKQGHDLTNNYMEENVMQPDMQQMGSGSPEEEMAQWAELAVGAPQGIVSDSMHYKAWNELPGAAGGQGQQGQYMSSGSQALPHQIDTAYDSYGAMITGSSPMTGSKPSTPTSSEDEFMTYLDSNNMAMGDDMMSMNMGASDLAPPPMFPSFPRGDGFNDNGGW